jgi:hypothetical protein
MAEKQERGHQPPAGSAAPEVAPEVMMLRQHQSNIVRMSFPEECRTLLRTSRYGVLSTLSHSSDSQGFPMGSIVGFADDMTTGAPVFSFSTMSGHTQDLIADGRASLTVTAPGFEGAADARVCVTGTVERVPVDTQEWASVKGRYLTVHPDAFWATFGDFSFWKMSKVISIRFVGGFARAGNIPPKLFAEAQPDPVAAHCGPHIAFANAHGDRAMCAVIRHQVGADVGVVAAKAMSADKHGLILSAVRSSGEQFKMRLAFPGGPVKTPQQVYESIVHMFALAQEGASK